jgi:membrane-bound lytic murein transglycosylase D
MTVRPIYRYNDVTSNTTIKKEIGVGVQFIENGIFTSTLTTTSQIKNQLINYILTNPGEIFFNPKFVLSVLSRAQVEIPKNPKIRKDFFKKLSLNVRSQTGQKNFIEDGIKRSLPYKKFLSTYFKKRKLPTELLAIPFLESSFNPLAQSKVNALGIWQFMPLISSYYVPRRTRHVDYRFNVGVASVAAAFLMSENFQITKSWDLAVTAYNSGTRHLLKTKRKLGNKNVNLQAIIENSDSRHFGFASKNFYSEFLALVHALAYREKFYSDISSEQRVDIHNDLRFFITKCNVNLLSDLNTFQLDDFSFHNHHASHKKLPKGFIVTSKSDLPKNKFYEINSSDLLKTKPKNWYKFITRSKCG